MKDFIAMVIFYVLAVFVSGFFLGSIGGTEGDFCLKNVTSPKEYITARVNSRSGAIMIGTLIYTAYPSFYLGVYLFENLEKCGK